jgi:hypothetical protein
LFSCKKSLKYLCHKLSRMCSACRNHNTILSSLIINHRVWCWKNMDVYKYISGVLGIPSFLGWNDDKPLKNHTKVNYIHFVSSLQNGGTYFCFNLFVEKQNIFLYILFCVFFIYRVCIVPHLSYILFYITVWES